MNVTPETFNDFNVPLVRKSRGFFKEKAQNPCILVYILVQLHWVSKQRGFRLKQRPWSLENLCKATLVQPGTASVSKIISFSLIGSSWF